MLFDTHPTAAPLNKTPAWKNILLSLITVVSLLYALPMVFGQDPALQISAERNAKVDDALKARVAKSLDGAKLGYFDAEIQGTNLQFRFNNTEDQIKAKDLLKTELGQDYIVALNLAAATPDWLTAIGAGPMRLGLDLRGGVHFLMEVDMATAIEKRETQYVDDFKTELRTADKDGKKTRYLTVARQNHGGVLLKFREQENRDNAKELLSRKFADLTFTVGESDGLFLITTSFSDAKLREIRDYAVQQNTTTLRNRVNELGVAEPVIQRQGAERIVVQLPGVQDTAQAKRILNTTASLEFRMVDAEHDVTSALNGVVPADSQLFSGRDGRPYLLYKKVILSGDHIVDASSGVDENGQPQVNINLDSAGGSMMAAETRNNVGKLMATVFIEYRTETKTVDGKEVKKLVKHEEVINAATVRSQLGSSFRITGIDSQTEAHNLSLSLRAGALIAPIQIVEERTIGPSMGAENIRMGMNAMLAAMAIVMGFMLLKYRVFGLAANVALFMNLVITVAVMSLIPGAVLTMPGIAGLVLGVALAVDANVLINERIREEMRGGMPPQQAIHKGYEEASLAITDSNLTNLISGLVLFGVGSGSIKGFAVTLCIGILVSMFSAVAGTRAIINAVYGGRVIKNLHV
ncbi:MAG: protein translocase subunit SecD [Gammaproteobacteria bacterium]|nr:protein translocase subunit SecD [Gammaproteobacteria bacterium]